MVRRTSPGDRPAQDDDSAQIKSGPGLKSYEFRAEREATWRELEKVLDIVDARGLRRLSAGELNRLPVLYRATVSSLSVARSISLDGNLVRYLESLSMRAYFVVYGPKNTVLQVFDEFFLHRFPGAVRRFRWSVAAAGLVLIIGGLTGFFLTSQDLDNYYSFIPEEQAQGRTPSATVEDLRAVLYADPEDADNDKLASFAAMLFTHNSAVGILCFALSVAPFALVFWLLFSNGVTLGAMTALYHERDLAVGWWSWILPHGITELLAIVLCGAAGFTIGHSILFPGPLPRLQSMSRRGREASMVVMGAIAMLFIAGLIEGMFRQRVHSHWVRYGLAGFTAVVWIGYFGFVGKRQRA